MLEQKEQAAAISASTSVGSRVPSGEYLLVKSPEILFYEEIALPQPWSDQYIPALIILREDWDNGGPFLGEFVFTCPEISDLQYYNEEGALGALPIKGRAEIIATIIGDNIKWQPAVAKQAKQAKQERQTEELKYGV